jgi:hypothetical protein
MGHQPKGAAIAGKFRNIGMLPTDSWKLAARS